MRRAGKKPTHSPTHEQFARSRFPRAGQGKIFSLAQGREKPPTHPHTHPPTNNLHALVFHAQGGEKFKRPTGGPGDLCVRAKRTFLPNVRVFTCFFALGWGGPGRRGGRRKLNLPSRYRL